MTEPYDLLNRALELAPVPGEDGTARDWVRHYAAEAMAASAAFRLLMDTGRGEELGYLSLLGNAAMSAAVALDLPPEIAANVIWELTPEAGALNGEWVDHLADMLASLGINPADLYPWFEAADSTTPLRLPKVEVGQ